MVLQRDGTTNLQESVNVLPASNFEVSPSYQDLVQTKFGGNIQSLAYTAPQDAVDVINRLVQEQTQDLVQDLVDNVNAQTELLLAIAASYHSMCHLLRLRGWGYLEEGLAV